jgi:hypothetical protein
MLAEKLWTGQRYKQKNMLHMLQTVYHTVGTPATNSYKQTARFAKANIMSKTPSNAVMHAIMIRLPPDLVFHVFPVVLVEIFFQVSPH